MIILHNIFVTQKFSNFKCTKQPHTQIRWGKTRAIKPLSRWPFTTNRAMVFPSYVFENRGTDIQFNVLHVRFDILLNYFFL